MRRFTLKPEHVKLLRHGCVTWNMGEAGAPGLDTKRPYGNSDVAGDVARILGIPVKRDAAGDACEVQAAALEDLHDDTETALAIILATGSFEPGTYEADDHGNNWRRIR